MTALSPCQHEEADTRMMLHLYHAAGQGHSKAFLRTVDCDVVVLAINIFHQLRLSALWIGYGIGKTCKDIPIHHISQIKYLDLNILIVALLPCFHRVRFSIINAWYRQKDCIECLECLSYGHQHLCRNNPRPEQSHTRLAAYATS